MESIDRKNWAFNLETVGAKTLQQLLRDSCSNRDSVRSQCWPVHLFAGPLHKSIDSFAISVGPRAHICNKRWPTHVLVCKRTIRYLRATAPRQGMRRMHAIRAYV